MNSLACQIQSAEIDFHRATFNIRPVELHELPGWWSQRVCWATSGWGRNDAFQWIQTLMLNAASLVVDHFGTSIDVTPVVRSCQYSAFDH